MTVKMEFTFCVRLCASDTNVMLRIPMEHGICNGTCMCLNKL